MLMMIRSSGRVAATSDVILYRGILALVIITTRVPAIWTNKQFYNYYYCSIVKHSIHRTDILHNQSILQSIGRYHKIQRQTMLYYERQTKLNPSSHRRPHQHSFEEPACCCSLAYTSCVELKGFHRGSSPPTSRPLFSSALFA